MLVAGAARRRVGAGRTVRRSPSAGGAAGAGRRRGRLDPRQAGRVLQAVLRPDPRRQGRRQRRLEPVRPVVPLRHLSRRRSRSRQGGDLVLRGRQRGDLEARRGAVVRVGAAAGAGRGGDRGRRGRAPERDRRDDEPCRQHHRDSQLRAHHPHRAAIAVGERARLHHGAADAPSSRRSRRRRDAGAPSRSRAARSRASPRPRSWPPRP